MGRNIAKGQSFKINGYLHLVLDQRGIPDCVDMWQSRLGKNQKIWKVSGE
jgi:hypothetical protein